MSGEEERQGGRRQKEGETNKDRNLDYNRHISFGGFLFVWLMVGLMFRDRVSL